MTTMNLIRFLLLAFIVSMTLSSCSTLKSTVYFQGDTTNYKLINSVEVPIAKIEVGDILGITVTSLDEDVNKMFEFPQSSGLRFSGLPNVQSSSAGLQPLGYEVDSSGSIYLPLIGAMYVKGRSCNVVSELVKNELSKFLKTPTINTRILNHRFTILGEVNRPATYNIVDSKMSLTEAIGMAGDLTIYGRRDNILLIREDEGKRFQVRLNLLNNTFLESKYYYIKNGDVVYVSPSEVKTTYNDRTYQLLPIVTSIVSAVTALGVLLINISR